MLMQKVVFPFFSGSFRRPVFTCQCAADLNLLKIIWLTAFIKKMSCRAFQDYYQHTI